MAKQVGTLPLNQFNMVTEDTILEGTLRVDQDVRISGCIIGAVEVGRRVVVTPEGVIEGEVEAVTADIAGNVQGDLFVAECLVLRSDARVEGTIRTGRLVIEEGALFNGTCQTGSDVSVSRKTIAEPDAIPPVLAHPNQEPRLRQAEPHGPVEPRPPERPSSPPALQVSPRQQAVRRRPRATPPARKGLRVVFGIVLVAALGVSGYLVFGPFQDGAGDRPVPRSDRQGTTDVHADPAETDAPAASDTPPAPGEATGAVVDPPAMSEVIPADEAVLPIPEDIAEDGTDRPVEAPPDDAGRQTADQPETPSDEQPDAPSDATSEQVPPRVRTVVRGLASHLKSSIEREDAGGMRAVFYRGWELFFEEVDELTAAVSTTNIEMAGTQATVDVQLDLQYRNLDSQAQQETRGYVWTLEQLGNDWILKRVNALP